MTPCTPRPTTFKADDGVRLSGTIYSATNPETVVVLAGATGVPEGYYARFATWLAETQNMAVLTFTYRDMEDPNPRNMRASRVTMQQWGIEDGQAARDAARAAFPDLPLWVIAHSLGGMCLSRQPRLDGVARVITIGSGLVDYHQHPYPYKLNVFLFWFVLGPLTTRIMGYLPGKFIGLGSTLPASVFWQWRKWCTAGPKGVLADDTLPPADWTRSAAPVRIVGITDDVICPVPCAHNLAAAFDGGEIEKIVIDPKSKGVAKLGHFGFFTRAGKPFWADLLSVEQG